MTPHYPPYKDRPPLTLALSLLPPPPHFSGTPPDRSSHFIYHLTAVVQAARRDLPDDTARITYASLFLTGAALDWFHGLLRRNVAAYLPAENARRAGQGAETLRVDVGLMYEMAKCPFVVEELVTFEGFLRALAGEFPDGGQ